MRLQKLSLALLLFAFGCHDKKQDASRAAAAKSAEEAQIDERAKAIAQDLIKRSNDEAETRRRAAEEQRTTELKRMRQAVIEHPEKYVSSDKLQVTDSGQRHITSVAITNTSKFTVSDIRGTVDFHGASGGPPPNDVVAQIPVALTGSLAPGASLVFSEQQHTIEGTGVQLATAPSTVSFTVTKVTVGMEGLEGPPVPAPAPAPGGAAPDAGAGATP